MNLRDATITDRETLVDLVLRCDQSYRDWAGPELRLPAREEELAHLHRRFADPVQRIRVAEFDGLFIRETTAVNHHTFRIARRAEAEGLVVVDDSNSILKCTNKVYLAELLTRHKISCPKTLVVHAENIDEIVPTLGLPVVLKQPDSAFSKGVTKVRRTACTTSRVIASASSSAARTLG